jgi:two-component system, NtrC family, sensor kinase
LPDSLRNRTIAIRKAIMYLNKSIHIAKEIGDIVVLQYFFSYLSQAQALTGNYKEAYESHINYSIFHDSAFSIKSQQKIAQLESKKEMELKEKELVIFRVKDKQQKIFILSIAAFLIMLLALIGIIVRSLRRKKKANDLLNHKNDEISRQKDALKESQSQLIQSEKMASLGMLTAGIAHEINNPVNFINSGVVSLQKDYEELDQFIQSLELKFPGAQGYAKEQGVDELLNILPQTIEDIKTGVYRTSEIVNGLRNFTSMDASELKDADIHEGLESTLLLLNSKIKDHITVVKEFDERIGLIKCYPGQLNQVFMNLLINSIDAIEQKFTKNPEDYSQHQIGITTKLDVTELHKQVKIVISDTGIGIPDEIKGKLFDPFFTTKEVGKGTGLGLSICHGIIEKHGGNITFISKINQGSTFTITIPAV